MSPAHVPDVVTEPVALAHLCNELRDAPWIAIDTEFVRERTYRARLALIQVATPQIAACVDPLAVAIEPLLDLLYAPTTLKVLHAARQDLEVFHDLRNDIPRPVFDTQIAAAFTSPVAQIGYGTLVEAITGIKLAKLHTRADWEQRPLTPEMIAYALDDVRYLRHVYTHLSGQLDTLGRRDWLAEECAALTDRALYRNDPDDAWRRIKAAPDLPPDAQPTLHALAAWRERTAQACDLPRAWVATDAELLALARARAATPSAVERLCAPRSALARRFCQPVLEAIQAAAALPKERLWPEPRPLTATEQAAIESVAARIRVLATGLDIAPAVIATRKAIQDLAVGGTGPLTRGWRAALLASNL